MNEFSSKLRVLESKVFGRVPVLCPNKEDGTPFPFQIRNFTNGGKEVLEEKIGPIELSTTCETRLLRRQFANQLRLRQKMAAHVVGRFIGAGSRQGHQLFAVNTSGDNWSLYIGPEHMFAKNIALG
jgi:hypothetical protein